MTSLEVRDSMSTIDLNLPESLKAFIDEQFARRGYRDASAFAASLLEAERQRQVGRDVEAMLLETLDGEFSAWTDKDVQDIRRTGRRLVEQRKLR
jgi:Arc/MetJ-type ribon-helix-helix transcriptional regulator